MSSTDSNPLDPLDANRIRQFFDELTGERLATGFACYLWVNDAGKLRPALATIPLPTIVQMIKDSLVVEGLADMGIGAHWLDTDPELDWDNFPIVAFKNIRAIMSLPEARRRNFTPAL